MRYHPGHKTEKRQQMLQASGALAKRNGFAASGVDALMKAAGMTSGAFYSHFGSKNDLLKALVEHELAASRALWAGNPHESLQDWLSHELDRYLSLSHVRHPEAGCIIPTLAAEIARADGDVKTLYQQELAKGLLVLEQRLGNRAMAWAFIQQMAGAVLMARALPNEASQKACLDAARQILLQTAATLAAQQQSAAAPDAAPKPRQPKKA